MSRLQDLTGEKLARRRAQMKAAARRARLKKFGITQAQYDQLVKQQHNRCACCGTKDPGRGNEYWCVDHEGVSGPVRGLLCHLCNAGIGLLGDTAEAVAAALRYLRRYEERKP